LRQTGRISRETLLWISTQFFLILQTSIPESDGKTHFTYGHESESWSGWGRVLPAAPVNDIRGPAMATGLICFEGQGTYGFRPIASGRGFFGAQMYERVHKPRGEFFHTNWAGHGEDTASSSYTVQALRAPSQLNVPVNMI